MLCRDDLRQRDGWKPKKAPEKVRLFEATQTTICERKEIFVAENENKELNQQPVSGQRNQKQCRQSKQ